MKNVTKKVPKAYKINDIELSVAHDSDFELYYSLKNLQFSYEQLFHYLNDDLFRNIQKFLKVSKSKILSSMMNVSEATFYRWSKNQKKVEEKHGERLASIIELNNYGTNAFGSKDLFLEWLNAENIHLSHKMPIEFLDSIYGIKVVTHLLDKIEYSAPV